MSDKLAGSPAGGIPPSGNDSRQVGDQADVAAFAAEPPRATVPPDVSDVTAAHGESKESVPEPGSSKGDGAKPPDGLGTPARTEPLPSGQRSRPTRGQDYNQRIREALQRVLAHKNESPRDVPTPFEPSVNPPPIEPHYIARWRKRIHDERLLILQSEAFLILRSAVQCYPT